MVMRETILCTLPTSLEQSLIAHPHILVRATIEQFLPARISFRVGFASESFWLQPVPVLTVHWWFYTQPVCVGRL